MAERALEQWIRSGFWRGLRSLGPHRADKFHRWSWLILSTNPTLILTSLASWRKVIRRSSETSESTWWIVSSWMAELGFPGIGAVSPVLRPQLDWHHMILPIRCFHIIEGLLCLQESVLGDDCDVESFLSFLMETNILNKIYSLHDIYAIILFFESVIFILRFSTNVCYHFHLWEIFIDRFLTFQIF